MTFLSTHFTEQELTPVREGVRKFIRLTGLIHDPNPLVWNKWFTDEGDLKAALHSIADAFKATHTMVGKRKYQGVDFDAPREVGKDMATWYLSGANDGEVALMRKRNLPMMYLVIEPVVQLFYKFDHETMIAVADELIADVIALVDNTTDYGTYDDALVAQAQVQQLIRQRDEARKAALEAKRKKSKRRDPLLDLLATYGAPEEGELDPEVEELYI
jgi:Arc/MetJ family transcription regulator